MDEAHPKIVTKNNNTTVVAVRYKLPINDKTINPTLKIPALIKKVLINAPVKYERTTIEPLIGEEL